MKKHSFWFQENDTDILGLRTMPVVAQQEPVQGRYNTDKLRAHRNEHPTV